MKAIRPSARHAIARSIKRLATRSSTILTIVAATIGVFVAPQVFAKDVTFVTDYGVNGRHAAYYVALDKGYYTQEGLNVTIVRGGGSADAIKKVAAGKAELGFADAGSLVLARGNDDVPVKLVSVIYQQAPHALYAIAGNGITKPQDLIGRKVADSATSSVAVMFGAYAKAAGLPKDSVHFIIADGTATPAMLATGRADAIGQYSVGEPLLAKVVAPRKLVRLAYKDVGLDFYSNGIIASEDTIKNDPETVRKFVAATIRGYKEAFRDPVEAGQILHRMQREVDEDIGTGETRAVAELSDIPGTPVGSMNAEKMQKTIDIVSNSFTLKHPVTVSDMMATGFTPK